MHVRVTHTSSLHSLHFSAHCCVTLDVYTFLTVNKKCFTRFASCMGIYLIRGASSVGLFRLGTPDRGAHFEAFLSRLHNFFLRFLQHFFAGFFNAFLFLTLLQNFSCRFCKTFLVAFVTLFLYAFCNTFLYAFLTLFFVAFAAFFGSLLQHFFWSLLQHFFSMFVDCTSRCAESCASKARPMESTSA